MSTLIGIRREDKNKWERRVPLIPADLSRLQDEHDLRFIVQPSLIRVYSNDDYRAAGVTVAEDLSAASLVFAVKEIPIRLLQRGKSYVYFSHVIKGQPHNMPMLQRLLDLGCTLVDYERIADEQERRLIFFSLHAGYAGMIESLWCLGQRLAAQGVVTPFADVRHAYEYDDLSAAKEHLRAVGARLQGEGLPAEVTPLVFGLAGYGNVSRGCQEILACLPVQEVPVAELAAAAGRPQAAAPALLKVVFKEEDMVRPRDPAGVFALQDYYQHPEKYRGTFAEHLPHLDVLMNTIYWDERYPRLVTRVWARENYGGGRMARLQVIGDISCDIEGSIELTFKATHPDLPAYVYNPERDEILDGCEGIGPCIMAVDNLPCELPRESSQHFSSVLRDLVPDLARADYGADFADLDLPLHLKKAVIVHRGGLTPAYTYLREHLPS
jgi:saccharopine dehydrogenase (NAD+, L-lysine-forming)